MTDKYITSSQYEKGLDSIKEYIDKSIPHIRYSSIFSLSADKVLEIYNSTNHVMEFDKPSNIDVNKEIIITYNNEDIIGSIIQNSPVNYIINFNNNDIDIGFYIGYDINQKNNENKMIIIINRLNTNITSDLVLKQREGKYLNNKYLKKDVAIQNSITIGTRLFGKNIGKYSFSNGNGTTASGETSHAEGNWSTASGEASHAEGIWSTASGEASHAEGNWSRASGDYSHAEGNETTASGDYSHAEGASTNALNRVSHAEGYYSRAEGDYSHAEGNNTIASSESQHVQGKYNIKDTEGKYAHIVGNGDSNNRSNAHTLDWNGNAWYAGDVQGSNLPYTVSSKVLTTVSASNVKLNNDITVNNVSINRDKRYYIEFLGSKKLCSLLISEKQGNAIICSIGNYNIQVYDNSTNIIISIIKSSQSDGPALDSLNDDQITTYDLNDSDIIANATDLVIYEEEIKYLDSKYLETDLILQNSISIGRVGDIGTGSSAIGVSVEALGVSSHAEGNFTTASGNFSHAEGASTTASGVSSHTEGNFTTASGNFSHAEGDSTTSSGESSHAEGNFTTASGNYSHAEGDSTTSSGESSHAEGNVTTASGNYSHAEGSYTTASSENQHVQGKYNIEDTKNKYAHIVGNGTDSTKSNAHTLDWNGNAWFAGKLTQEGTPTDDKDLITKKYVDDKISNIPDAYTLLYPKEVNGENAYYDIYDLPLGDYRIAQQSGITTWNICVYFNNIRNQILSTQNCRGFSFTKRSNSKITSSDEKTGKMIVIDVFSATTGGEIFTFVAYDDGSIKIISHKATILSANTNTEFTPTKDYQPATKKYVDDAKASIVVPTKTSELTNDSNFLTEHQSLTKYATIEYVDSKLTTNYVSKEELTESTKPADTTTVKTTLNDILGGDYIE